MPQLQDMSYAELRAWLSDRLQLRGPAAADINQRIDEPAYERPLAEWKEGEKDFREQIERACESLVGDVAQKQWATDHVHNLAALIEQAEMVRAIPALKDVVYAKAWLFGDDGPQRHMIALRTLLGLNWRGEPNFWLEQHELLGRRYPEMAFKGLLQQGLEPAFARLGEVAGTPEAMRQVLILFPALIALIGTERLRELLAIAAGSITREVYDVIADWARARGYGELVVGDRVDDIPSEAHLRALALAGAPQYAGSFADRADDAAEVLSGRVCRESEKHLQALPRPPHGTGSSAYEVDDSVLVLADYLDKGSAEQTGWTPCRKQSLQLSTAIGAA